MSGLAKKKKEEIIATVVRSINTVVTLTISIPGRGKTMILPAQATLSKTFAKKLGKNSLQKGEEVVVHFPVTTDLQSGMVLRRNA